jgi:large subunit ribosomal protein L22
MTSKTATAKLSNHRQAPRKVRLVADLIRGKSVPVALRELSALPRRAAPAFTKLVSSAVANAKALGIDEKGLVVKSLTVDKGPVMKRMMPRAHGRGFPIHKHTSHITVTLSGVAKDVTPAISAATAPKKATKKTAPAKEEKAPAKKTKAKSAD